MALRRRGRGRRRHAALLGGEGVGDDPVDLFRAGHRGIEYQSSGNSSFAHSQTFSSVILGRGTFTYLGVSWPALAWIARSSEITAM